MTIKSVCYLGEHDEVLFFYTTDEKEKVSSRFSIYSTLNNINKIMESYEKKTANKKYDPYLGYVGVNLSLFSSYKNYAYIIKVINFKIILTIENNTNKYSDDNLREIFKKLHQIYADTVCNPFYEDTLETPLFLKKISNICLITSQQFLFLLSNKVQIKVS